MPSENHEKNTNKQPDNTVNSASNFDPVNANSDSSSNQSATGKKRRRKKSDPQKKVAVEVISIPEKEDRHAINANKISIVAAIVNFFLFLIGAIAVGVSWGQYQSSQTAAEIAKQTLKLQITQSHSADNAEKERLKREERALALQDSSVNAQIKALQETQKEFELQNKPFVQIIDMGLDNIKSGESPIIKFNFKVFGKQPVKLRDNKIQIYYWHDKNLPDFLSRYEYDTISAYLGEGGLFQESRRTNIPFNNADSIAIKNGISYFYVNGYLRYKNTVTSSENYYHYRYKFGYSAGQFNATGLIDTTIEVKPKMAK